MPHLPLGVRTGIHINSRELLAIGLDEAGIDWCNTEPGKQNVKESNSAHNHRATKRRAL